MPEPLTSFQQSLLDAAEEYGRKMCYADTFSCERGKLDKEMEEEKQQAKAAFLALVQRACECDLTEDRYAHLFGEEKMTNKFQDELLGAVYMLANNADFRGRVPDGSPSWENYNKNVGTALQKIESLISRAVDIKALEMAAKAVAYNCDSECCDKKSHQPEYWIAEVEKND